MHRDVQHGRTKRAAIKRGPKENRGRNDRGKCKRVHVK